MSIEINDYSIFGERNQYSVPLPPSKEEAITKAIIDALRNFPLSDDSYKRIQIELMEIQRRISYQEPERLFNILDRQLDQFAHLNPMKKDFISEDEMEIPLE